MASTFKMFLNDDTVTSRTLLHEAIPITGSIVYGTYGNGGSETHVKTYAHGMFQSVYDYPFLSSSANHIFDMTFGHHVDFGTYGVDGTDSSDNVGGAGKYDGITLLPNLSTHDYYSKRKNVYGQMAQVLVGHDVSGNIQKFDVDGDLVGSTTDKYNSLIFFSFARLLGKDEIKKGSFEIQVGVTPEYAGAAAGSGRAIPKADAALMHVKALTIKDDGAATDYRVNSPAGEYGILKVTADDTHAVGGAYEADAAYDRRCGLIFYQAGIVALSPNIFMKFHASDYKGGKISDQVTPANLCGDHNSELGVEMYETGADKWNVLQMLNSNTFSMDLVSEQIRKRIKKICFNNTTELNSTIYFCRINHNDFNYSSNPTYLNNSQIRVKTTLYDAPVSYVTSVGLYSADNELLAVAKLSEPLRKDPTNDITLRVRLDY